MNVLDRLLIRSYLKAYVVCLISLLSLYIVIDLFTNIDDFTERNHKLGHVLKHIGFFYGFRVFQIFDRLAEVIVLLAAMFTVAWMQRNNELLPLLSAGISTRRVVRPVFIAAGLMLGLGLLNQELIIPPIATYLLTDRDDPYGQKDIIVHGAWEPNGIHIEGRLASRQGMVVRDFCCVIPESIAGSLINLTAQEGRYIPPGPGPHTGGWLLTGAMPAEMDRWNTTGRVLELIDPGKYFLHTQEVDFDTITRSRSWFTFASTLRLREELGRPDSTRLAGMAVLFHMRLTRPILALILVFLGLSIILRDQTRNVFVSAGMCLVLCAVFFAALFTCKHLGDNEYISPALTAWLPVLCFGPLAFAMFDAVHT